LEAALSVYSIIPEVAFGVTSVTTKPTRTFGSFTYRTIKPAAFTGYRIIQQNGFNIRIAEPEKALVDYLYFKQRKKEAVSGRFEKIMVNKLDKKKIAEYAALYALDLKKALGRIYAEL
jgi:predicted transcriptional regulator of viral defense system